MEWMTGAAIVAVLAVGMIYVLRIRARAQAPKRKSEATDDIYPMW